MLTTDNTLLLIVDVQGNLARVMHRPEYLLEHVAKLIRGAQVLGLPLLLTEQIPEKMGTTVPEIADLLPDVTPLAKRSFSCCGAEAFMRALTVIRRHRIVLAGIEAHVCVYQTAVDLVHMGYEVHLAADATSSRTAENRQIALQRLHAEGVHMSSTEMVLFELLKEAGTPEFRELLQIIK